MDKFRNRIKQVSTKEVNKVQTKKVQDKFEKKGLPTKYEKKALQIDKVKGKVPKEIV